MKKYLLLNLFVLLLLVAGCTEDEKGPLVKNNSTPGLITDIEVENIPGGAKISYTLPNDNQLLYIIATYSTKEGVSKQAKSSIFKPFLLLEGFSEIREYTVSLRSVDRSDNYSPEVSVKINPLEAPVHEVLRTIKVDEAWGGARVSMHNELQQEYILYTLLKDSITGNWREYDRLYTSAKDRDFYARGLPPIPTEFAFYLTDKWSNSSDTLFSSVTPLYEVEFDKSLFKDAALADDSNDPLYRPLYQLWTPGPKTYFFQKSAIGYEMPNWITIDLGRKYVFGRFKLNMVNHANTWIFGSCTPRLFEIWVSNTPTTDWSQWTFYGEYEMIKPSGLPVGQVSDDDQEMILNGADFNFPIKPEGYQYMRFKAIETFGGTGHFCALEFTLWGQPYDK